MVKGEGWKVKIRKVSAVAGEEKARTLSAALLPGQSEQESPALHQTATRMEKRRSHDSSAQARSLGMAGKHGSSIASRKRFKVRRLREKIISVNKKKN